MKSVKKNKYENRFQLEPIHCQCFGFYYYYCCCCCEKRFHYLYISWLLARREIFKWKTKNSFSLFSFVFSHWKKKRKLKTNELVNNGSGNFTFLKLFVNKTKKRISFYSVSNDDDGIIILLVTFCLKSSIVLINFNLLKCFLK